MRTLERAGAKRTNGYGLLKMRERFTQLGGRVDIQSCADGARDLAFVPVERAETDE